MAALIRSYRGADEDALLNLWRVTMPHDRITPAVWRTKVLLDPNFDPDGLLKLLTNLAANALDACRFDPAYGDKVHVISLRCLRDRAGNTVFAVEDNGAGIPGDVHHKVFESFFSTKGTEGTGLGLLVVQKVVEEHGGQITFTSAEGRGTRFRAVLPGRPAPAGATAPDQVMEG